MAIYLYHSGLCDVSAQRGKGNHRKLRTCKKDKRNKRNPPVVGHKLISCLIEVTNTDNEYQGEKNLKSLRYLELSPKTGNFS